MSMPKQPIFRANAMRHYMRNQEKNAYLRFVPLPITILLWVLLGLILMVGFTAWNEQIPEYTNAPGLVVSPLPAKTSAHNSEANTHAILFFPPEQTHALHTKMLVDLFIGGATQPLEGQITTIASKTSSPTEIQMRYEHTNCSLLVPKPVTEVTVTLPSSVGERLSGSLLVARIKIGSRRLLALLPGMEKFFT